MQSKRRLVATLVAFVLVLLSLPLSAARAADSPTPASNPDLAASCGLDISIVIDRSGSIGNDNDEVQDAAQAFNDALIGTGSKVQLVSFSDSATAEPGGSSALGDLAFVDPADLDVPTFTSAGYTNWDDALEVVRRSPAGHAPLVVMITDGDPTRRNSTQPDGHGGGVTGTSTTQATIDAAVAEANLLKALPSHLFVVGVGSALSNPDSVSRIQGISGPHELTFSGGTPNIDFGVADYTLVEEFTALKTTISRFVRELCGPSLNVVKKLQMANGTTVDATDATTFTFTTSMNPIPSAWTSPAQAPGQTALLSTSGGVANFAWDPATPTSDTVITLGEQSKAGWAYNGIKCWRNNLDGTPAQLVLNDVGQNAVGASKTPSVLLPAVGAYQAMNCEVFNRQIRTANVSVDKVTVPGGRPESFSFALRSGGDTVGTIPSMTDATAATAFGAVAPGTYDVVEADAAHFTKTSATCDDLATQGKETVSATGLAVGEGSSWQCTFTNTLHDGSIRIVKDLNGAPGGTFGFTSNVPGHAAFDLSPTSASDASVTFPVAPGTYAVAEGPHGPYALSASCDHQSDPAHIVVLPDVQTTCTFTNTAPAPTVVVDKSAATDQLPEPGGDVTYTVSVTNTSIEPLTLTKLVDTIGGDDLDVFDLPPAKTTCLPLEGSTVAPGATVACTFVAPATGNAGSSVTDTVKATLVDADGNAASDTDTATVRITDVVPSLTVTKSTLTPTIPEPGGPVSFDVTVTNTSGEGVTLTSLTDQISGGPLLPLTSANGPITQSDCALAPIAPGATYSCSFTALVGGNAGDLVGDVVKATAVDDDGSSVSDTAAASVTLTDVLPHITVTKAAGAASVPEPGADVTYTVGIHNDTAEAVVLSSVTDSVGGAPAFAVGGTCDDLVGTTLPAGASTSCTFTLAVQGDASDGPVGDTVTVGAHDDEQHAVTASASASVGVTDVLPTVTVTKSAADATVDEPGGVVSFTVGVTNTSVEPVTVDSLVDSVDGGAPVDLATLPGTCDDLIGTTLAPGASDGCTFQLAVSGNAGDEVEDLVTVSVGDDDGNQGTASDGASITVTDVLPAIAVTKAADVATLPEPGGDVTYTVEVTNQSVEPVSLTSLSDVLDGGPPVDVTDVAGTTCVLPQELAVDGSYSCTFTLAASGNAGDELGDVVTATAEDDDGNDVSQTADASVGVTDVAPTITVTKDTTTPDLDAPGGAVEFTVTVVNTSPEPVTIAAITDLVGDDELDVTVVADPVTATTCATGVELAAAGDEGATSTCTFTLAVEGAEAAEIDDTVTVVVHDDEENEATGSDDATVNLAAVADLAIEKEATVVPTAGQTGTYALTVTNLGPSTATDVTVTDELPALQAATSASGDGWDCTIADQGASVTCTREALALGAAAPITIVVSVGEAAAGVSVTNTATVASPVPDPDPTNNSDSVTLVPSIVLDASSPPVVSGDLPRTGFDPRGWLVLADVLLIVGVAAMFVEPVRRRFA